MRRHQVHTTSFLSYAHWGVFWKGFFIWGSQQEITEAVALRDKSIADSPMISHYCKTSLLFVFFFFFFFHPFFILTQG